MKYTTPKTLIVLLSALTVINIVALAFTLFISFSAPQQSFAGPTVANVPQGGTGWGNITADTLLTGNGTGRLATTSIGSGLTLSGGVLSSAGSSFPFTAGTFNGQNINATSTGLRLLGSPLSLIASSTLVGNATTTNATTTNLNASGAIDFDSLTSALIVTGAGGILAEYAGTSCTNQFVRSLDALGASTCATVGSADVSGLDISADTNLAVTWPIVLTDDTLSWGGLSTSTALADTQVLYGTAVNTVGSESAFVYDYGLNRLTVPYASTTAFTVTGPAYITTADASNQIGLTVTQSDITNNLAGIKVSSAVSQVNTGAREQLYLEGTNAGVAGPFVGFYFNSASPTTNDYFGQNFYFNNSGASKTYAGGYSMELRDVAAGSETTDIYFRTLNLGTNAVRFQIGVDGNGPLNGITVGASSAAGIVSSFGAQSLQFKTGDVGSTSPMMTLTNAGNLGIATTSPLYKLSVEGTSTLGNQAIAGYFTATSTTSSTFPYASTTALTVNGSAYLAKTSGQVIIGTQATSTTALLEVSSQVAADGTLPTTLAITGIRSSAAWTYGASIGNIDFYNNDTTGGGAGVRGRISSVAEAAGGNVWGLTFSTVPSSNGTLTERMHIDGSGNVGIATTTPFYKFSVEGSSTLGNQAIAGYFTATSTTATSTFQNALGVGTSTTGTVQAAFTVKGILTTIAQFFSSAGVKILELTTAGATALGVWDFGGATSLEIPNGGPTVDTTGEIGVDTTSGQFKWSYNDSTVGVAVPFYSLAFTIASTTWSAATNTIYLAPAIQALTVTEAHCETDTGTLSVSLYDGTNRANFIPTASTTKNTFVYSTNNTFTSNESMRVDIGQAASSPTKLACRFKYTYTAD